MEALERIYLFSDTSRGDYDAAAANFQAAVGLRGAEDLDCGYGLIWLNRVANRVHIETLRHSYQFRERPEDFENSPAYFCMLVMATVLRKEFGVRYNPDRIRDPKFQDPNCFDPDFSDSRDLFIHGMIGGPGGTCASMPVLFVAVGRRLGYPLKLVKAKGHLFVRWDDPNGEKWSPGARFNIEATSEGLWCPPDEHYMKWPVPITEQELARGIYLRSLEPKEEVAMFRATRAICLWENGCYADALRECAIAIALAPQDQEYVWQIMDLYKKYRAIMATKSPEEIAELALYYDEEIELQKNIVRGHHERLRRGQPGYNLAEFGIYPKPLTYEDHKLLLAPERLVPNQSLPKTGRATVTSDVGVHHPPAVQEALAHLERVKQQNELNRQNQERLWRGPPGFNPKNRGF